MSTNLKKYDTVGFKLTEDNKPIFHIENDNDKCEVGFRKLEVNCDINNITIESIYLIARAKIRLESLNINKKLSENIKRDYMGSAEFEFGATIHSLLRTMYYMKYYKLYKTDFINKDKQPLYIFHRFIKDVDLNNYLSDLNSVIQREKRCKEFTHLPEAIDLSKKEKKTNLFLIFGLI